MNNMPFPAQVVLWVFISFAFFLIIREFVCWYLKINVRVRLMEEILSELKKQNNSVSQNKDNKSKKQNEVQDEKEIITVNEEAVEDPFWNKKR